MEKYAPIALFVFNRPDHLKQTLNALKKNQELIDSPLYFFCDGARNDREAKMVNQVRQVVKDFEHPQKIIVERSGNWGLARSIISGVSQLCEKLGEVIVLEDDMVTSPFFLKYMNESLDMFRNDARVISIHGYAFPIDGLPEAYFIKGASCWGWGTWKRGWDLFEEDGSKLLQALNQRNLLQRFDLNGIYPYKKMLQKQIKGQNNSWAIRWYASALLNDKLTLHPGRSLVHNIGLDGSGSHCDQYDGFATVISEEPILLNDIEVIESSFSLGHWCKYLRSVRRDKFLSNIRSVQKLYKKLQNLFSRRK